MDIKDFKIKYKITDKVLGASCFGNVIQATLADDKTGQSKVALKVLSKQKFFNNLNLIFDEIEMLKSLDHPNIVKHIEAFENQSYLYIITELCEGTDLFTYVEQKIQKEGKFKEIEAALIFKQLLLAIMHCHSYNIVHRDIKPSNILVSPTGDVKLIDFGLAKKIPEKEMEGQEGTLFFMAPEVVKDSKYGLECDLWSLGLVLSILLSGKYPFDIEKPMRFLMNMQEGKEPFKLKELEGVSEEGNDLIKRLLVADPEKRMTAKDCYEHSWFRQVNDSPEETKINTNILENLKEFKSASSLHKTALNAFVKMFSDSQIKELNHLFRAFDTNLDGYITAKELAQILEENKMFTSDTEIDSIIAQVDFKGNQQINYSEFAAATLDANRVLNGARLDLLFKEFDVDHSGYITKENLVEAYLNEGKWRKEDAEGTLEGFCGNKMEFWTYGLGYKRMGKKISKKEIEVVFEKHDLAKDGKISKKEFEKMILGEE